MKKWVHEARVMKQKQHLITFGSCNFNTSKQAGVGRWGEGVVLVVVSVNPVPWLLQSKK